MTTRSVPAHTGSNYRTRLFWKWQAWRLRKLAAPEGSRSVNLFSNFSALDHRGYADAVCELLPSLVDAAGVPAPTSAAQVRQRLKRELGLQSCAAILANDAGVVGGYAWGRVTTGSSALDSYRHIPNLASLEAEDWQRLQAVLGEKPLLVLYSIGLAANYRYGFSPLKLLLKPLFDLGLNCHARHAFWWAPRESAMHDISVAFGARSVLVKDSAVFFVHDDIASIARVLSVLPSVEISDLLARVGPARRPRIRVTSLPAGTAIRPRQQDLEQKQDDAPVAIAPTIAATTTVAAIAAAPVASVQPLRIVSDEIASNDADAGDGALNLLFGDQPAESIVALADQAAIEDGTLSPDAKLEYGPPLHELPARLAALFPRLAS